MMTKRFLRSLLAALVLCPVGVPKISACIFCERMARLSRTNHDASPSDAAPAVDDPNPKAKPAAIQPDLSSPPPAGGVVTRISDLQVNRANPVGPGARRLPPVARDSRQASPPAGTARPAPGAGAETVSAHWADAGLMSLAAVGGLFCWRTRRKPVSSDQ